MLGLKWLLFFQFILPPTDPAKSDFLNPEINIKDINDQTLKFKEVIIEKQLFYRIKEIYCGPCVDRIGFLR